MLGRLGEVVVDCDDPMALAEFWQRVLGGYVVRHSHEWVALEPPTGVTIGFQKVPEAKTVKNRVHLDVDVADLQVATEAAEALGAVQKPSEGLRGIPELPHVGDVATGLDREDEGRRRRLPPADARPRGRGRQRRRQRRGGPDLVVAPGSCGR